MSLREVLLTLKHEINVTAIREFAEQLIKTHERGGRVWLAGNGGSAAIASHFASDLAALGFDVVCMTDNVPRITAITNDHGWVYVYVHQMKGHFTANDCLVLISVHGATMRNWSANLSLAASYAESRQAAIMLIAGNGGGDLAARASHKLCIRSYDPYVAEGVFSVLTHLVCSIIREEEE